MRASGLSREKKSEASGARRFSSPGSLRRPTKAPCLRILRWFAPPAIYSVSNNDHDSLRTPSPIAEGGRMPNHRVDECISPLSERSCMGAGGCGAFCSSQVRNRQYNFTANFRATATAAILRPRRKARRW